MKTRYQSQGPLMFGAPESKKELAHLPRCKALVELRISALLFKTGVMYGRKHAVMGPASGSCFLVTAPGCKPQRLHCDVSVNGMETSGGRPPADPGYFCIFTGPQQDAVRIVPRSHFAVNELVDAKKGKDFSASYFTEQVIIPPFSVLAVRADVLHDGEGMSDVNGTRRIRGHILFVRADRAIPDHVYYHDHNGLVPLNNNVDENIVV